MLNYRTDMVESIDSRPRPRQRWNDMLSVTISLENIHRNHRTSLRVGDSIMMVPR